MVNVNQLNQDDGTTSRSETPPEEVLISELVDTDRIDPISEALLEEQPGSEQRIFKLRVPNQLGSGVTGGDPDDDWYQAEVVGEEAVGGDNPTPDQNVTEELQRSMGITATESEAVRTHSKLQWRDHQRWELNPESAEDYQDRD
jgi:hypothetical protein